MTKYSAEYCVSSMVRYDNYSDRRSTRIRYEHSSSYDSENLSYNDYREIIERAIGRSSLETLFSL